MSTSTIAANNGKVRRSLAGEIDRLDKTLDGLAENLNEAVGEAVRTAVGESMREMVQTVLAEMLNNTEVLAKLRATMAATPAPAPEPLDAPRTGLRARLACICTRIRDSVRSMRQAAANKLEQVVDCVRGVGQRVLWGLIVIRHQVTSLTNFRPGTALSFAAGVATGIVARFVEPRFVGTLNGWYTRVVAWMAQVSQRHRRTFAAHPFQSYRRF